MAVKINHIYVIELDLSVINYRVAGCSSISIMCPILVCLSNLTQKTYTYLHIVLLLVTIAY